MYGNLQQICLLQLTRGLHTAQLLFLREMESLLRVNNSVTINYTLFKTYTYRITNGYWKITVYTWNFWFSLGFSLFIFSQNFSFSGYSLYLIFCFCFKQLLLWSDGMKGKSWKTGKMHAKVWKKYLYKQSNRHLKHFNLTESTGAVLEYLLSYINSLTLIAQVCPNIPVYFIINMRSH